MLCHYIITTEWQKLRGAAALGFLGERGHWIWRINAHSAARVCGYLLRSLVSLYQIALLLPFWFCSFLSKLCCSWCNIMDSFVVPSYQPLHCKWNMWNGSVFVQKWYRLHASADGYLELKIPVEVCSICFTISCTCNGRIKCRFPGKKINGVVKWEVVWMWLDSVFT